MFNKNIKQMTQNKKYNEKYNILKHSSFILNYCIYIYIYIYIYIMIILLLYYYYYIIIILYYIIIFYYILLYIDLYSIL